jgi:hypothetical protein
MPCQLLLIALLYLFLCGLVAITLSVSCDHDYYVRLGFGQERWVKCMWLSTYFACLLWEWDGSSQFAWSGRDRVLHVVWLIPEENWRRKFVLSDYVYQRMSFCFVRLPRKHRPPWVVLLWKKNLPIFITKWSSLVTVSDFFLSPIVLEKSLLVTKRNPIINIITVVAFRNWSSS